MIYHPALDPHHAAYRILSVLRFAPESSYERDAIRILDFYATFPELIYQIRIPRNQTSWRAKFPRAKNHYWFTGDPRDVFRRMQPIQEAALQVLDVAGFIDSAEFAVDRVRLSGLGIGGDLAPSTTLSDDLLAFLTGILGTVRLSGVGGLKHRTQLLEYRYDLV